MVVKKDKTKVSGTLNETDAVKTELKPLRGDIWGGDIWGHTQGETYGDTRKTEFLLK